MKHPNKFIEAKGVRVHNLKNISVDIPKNNITVITGLSGSGKSSLTIDTIYNEGQRKYVESLSSYARQFLTRMPKPDVDYIKGLSPTIAIEQKISTKSARSTVGSLTEIYDYLRMLYARIGKTFSPVSNREVKKFTTEDVFEFIQQLPNETKFLITTPININPEIKPTTLINQLTQKGFTRFVFEHQVKNIDEIELQHIKQKQLQILVARYVKSDFDLDTQHRISDSIQMAIDESNGYVSITTLNPEIAVHTFSNLFQLDEMLFEEPYPQFFNFNSPSGACPHCEGFGTIIGIDEDKVIPNKNLSVYDDAVVCWKSDKMSEWKHAFIMHANKADFPIHKPYNQLSEYQRNQLWNGTKWAGGINQFFDDITSQAYKIQYRVMLSRYRGVTACTTCKGIRLNIKTNYVKIEGKNIGELLQMPIKELLLFFDNIKLNETDTQIAERLIFEIKHRIQLLLLVGLDYLLLNRKAETLSGGETQRINLTRMIGSNLTSAIYILDEPSIGLHPRDTHNLIKVLQSLKQKGNTVIIVEHEEEIMRMADYLIDIGPKAGEQGGEVVFSGNFKQLDSAKNSLTAAYLTHKKQIEVPATRRNPKQFVHFKNIHLNNLKNLELSVPLQCICVITGVSGSGKSTLVKEIVYQNLKGLLEQQSEQVSHANVSGDISKIKQIEFINQNPIGRSSRSNPVTYIKAYDSIRELYAKQSLSKLRAYKSSHFSFNIDGGRCETCQGDGETVVEMQFMSDVHLTCEACNGKRFKKEILEVTHKNKSIADVLEMTVNQAIEFFSDQKDIQTRLEPLEQVGLGYIRLGQSSSTLSGGEAQRIKLASFLGKGAQHSQHLFIFDEPTTGLHFDDINTLLKVFNALVEAGNSLIIVEHNLEIIKCADYIVDLGPEGGDNGGNIVAQGTPEQVVKSKQSYTAQFLKEKLL